MDPQESMTLLQLSSGCAKRTNALPRPAPSAQYRGATLGSGSVITVYVFIQPRKDADGHVASIGGRLQLWGLTAAVSGGGILVTLVELEWSNNGKDRKKQGEDRDWWQHGDGKKFPTETLPTIGVTHRLVTLRQEPYLAPSCSPSPRCRAMMRTLSLPSTTASVVRNPDSDRSEALYVRSRRYRRRRDEASPCESRRGDHDNDHGHGEATMATTRRAHDEASSSDEGSCYHDTTAMRAMQRQRGRHPRRGDDNDDNGPDNDDDNPDEDDGNDDSNADKDNLNDNNPDGAHDEAAPSEHHDPSLIECASHLLYPLENDVEASGLLICSWVARDRHRDSVERDVEMGNARRSPDTARRMQIAAQGRDGRRSQRYTGREEETDNLMLVSDVLQLTEIEYDIHIFTRAMFHNNEGGTTSDASVDAAEIKIIHSH
ncbi:hypothetical protein EDB85DRAFT_2273509 [Lactarius pseudohatsudake]|nr:hypothetical protein EDB85DRAFT_2273509 [Lactarius pseudohatsudake]